MFLWFCMQPASFIAENHFHPKFKSSKIIFFFLVLLITWLWSPKNCLWSVASFLNTVIQKRGENMNWEREFQKKKKKKTICKREAKERWDHTGVFVWIWVLVGSVVFAFLFACITGSLKKRERKSKTASMEVLSLLEKALQCKRESANLHCGKRIKRYRREKSSYFTLFNWPENWGRSLW